MAHRKVRPDRETEANLRQPKKSRPSEPFKIYEKLDLGPGGYSRSPSTQASRGVKKAIRKKLRK